MDELGASRGALEGLGAYGITGGRILGLGMKYGPEIGEKAFVDATKDTLRASNGHDFVKHTENVVVREGLPETAIQDLAERTRLFDFTIAVYQGTDWEHDTTPIDPLYEARTPSFLVKPNTSNKEEKDSSDNETDEKLKATVAAERIEAIMNRAADIIVYSQFTVWGARRGNQDRAVIPVAVNDGHVERDKAALELARAAYQLVGKGFWKTKLITADIAQEEGVLTIAWE